MDEKRRHLTQEELDKLIDRSMRQAEGQRDIAHINRDGTIVPYTEAELAAIGCGRVAEPE